MSRRLPLVAIVGAPNAGKSTLWNRLVTKGNFRKGHDLRATKATHGLKAFRPSALVSPMAGTTRDRLETVVELNDVPRFRLVDTGGVYGLDDVLSRKQKYRPTVDEDGIIVELDVSKKQEKKTAAPIERLVEEQVLKAVRGASVVLFMVDGKAGLSVTDERLAPVVRKIGNEPGPPSVLLVANKMDYDRTGERSGYMAEFYALGVGDPIGVSAKHGTGVVELLERIVEELPPPTAGVAHDDDNDDDDETVGEVGAQSVTVQYDWSPAGPTNASATDEEQVSALEDADEDADDAYDDLDESILADLADEYIDDEYLEAAERADAELDIEGRRVALAEAVHGVGLDDDDSTGGDPSSMASGSFFGILTSRNELKLAVVGRPNVGKSSLVNRLLGEPRMVVHHEAGTTRDSIAAPLEHKGMSLLVADTAGIRRPAQGGAEREDLDRMAVQRARQMIMSCHAALIVFDASVGLLRGDLQVADLVTKHQKSCVFLANKCDLIDEEERAQVGSSIHERLPMLGYAPVVTGSALHGDGIEEAMDLVAEAARWRSTRVPRKRLNELFQRAQVLRPLPYVKATKSARAGRMSVRYVLQAPTEAPTFVFHMNRAGELHPSDVRWLENTLRSQWAFTGTPLRFVFRTRETRARRMEDARTEYKRRKRVRTRDVKKRLEYLRSGGSL